MAIGLWCFNALYRPTIRLSRCLQIGTATDDSDSDMTVEQLCLYSRFSHSYVSTECNAGPIINIILLELLVLMATYESLNTTGPPLVMIIGTVSLRA